MRARVVNGFAVLQSLCSFRPASGDFRFLRTV